MDGLVDTQVDGWRDAQDSEWINNLPSIKEKNMQSFFIFVCTNTYRSSQPWGCRWASGGGLWLSRRYKRWGCIHLGIQVNACVRERGYEQCVRRHSLMHVQGLRVS